ncbi:MAG: regulatory iron-sulfur-containing complex subunit RicT [Patescibacteria group bacterium]|nr:stage 0 sporulation protein [Patescibacteria group bacterium]MBU1870850.1 stage 0 sporulation protein [Patescibacteria group bacterium]
MKIVQIQFSPWDKKYNFDSTNYFLEINDTVIVETEMGLELGVVVGFKEIDKAKLEQHPEIKPIIRKASIVDLKKIPDKKQKKKDLEYCKKVVSKYELLMKLVDVNYSFDGSRLTFAFIADGRIDFRELVKELTRYFNRTIRLQQIGIRDEAKIIGDFGHCGRQLCCKRFLNEFTSITSEMAELQQCTHRGSERISGVCGRLMCCLAYEEEGYKNLCNCLPLINSEVKVENKKGKVVKYHALKQTVDVLLYGGKEEGGGIVEVEIEKLKKVE